MAAIPKNASFIVHLSDTNTQPRQVQAIHSNIKKGLIPDGLALEFGRARKNVLQRNSTSAIPKRGKALPVHRI